MTTLPTSLPRRRDMVSPLVAQVLFLGIVFLVLLLFIEPVRPSGWILAGCLGTGLSLIWADTAEWRAWRKGWEALAAATGCAILYRPPRFPFRTGYICLNGEYRGYRIKLQCPEYQGGQVRRLHQYTQVTLEGVSSPGENCFGTLYLQSLGRRLKGRNHNARTGNRDFDRVFWTSGLRETTPLSNGLINCLIELAEVGRFQYMQLKNSTLIYREQDRITDHIYLKALLDRLVYVADQLDSKNPGAPG